jgi:hypothetical protein
LWPFTAAIARCGGGDVERDLGRVHLEGEVDVDLVEGVEDRVRALGEVGEAGLPGYACEVGGKA